MISKLKSKNDVRRHRHARVRGKITGSAARPRLVIFKSNRYVSAQLVNDAAGKTLASAHGRSGGGAQAAQAARVGKEIAAAAKAAGVTTAVFDRGGYRYAGVIKTLADAARENGLSF